LVGDGADKARLVGRALRERITNVRFLDPIPKQEMPGLLAAVDAGVVCFADRPIFRRHMSANKLYDYMAAGIPVVNAVPGEGARYVEASGAGVNVEPDQLTQGVRLIVEMTTEERERLGAAGRCYIAKNQSRTAMAARLEAVLDSLASSA
jgi:glycosyltransferase involved in cell wall biosynthesis